MIKKKFFKTRSLQWKGYWKITDLFNDSSAEVVIMMCCIGTIAYLYIVFLNILLLKLKLKLKQILLKYNVIKTFYNLQWYRLFSYTEINFRTVNNVSLAYFQRIYIIS